MKQRENPSHYQSLTGFIVVKEESKKEQPAKWEWLTQARFRHSLNHRQQYGQECWSYRQKKGILTGLDCDSKALSSFKIKQGFSKKQRNRGLSSGSCPSMKTKSQKRLQPFFYLNSNRDQMQIPASNFGIDGEQLERCSKEVRERGNRILGIISVRRMGLRFRFNHAFVEYFGKGKSGEQHDLRELSSMVRQKFKEYNYNEKELYYYSVRGDPINNYGSIGEMKLRVVIVDSSPRLQFTRDLELRIIQHDKRMEATLSIFSDPLEGEKQNATNKGEGCKRLQSQEQIYDYQRIKNVKQYAARLAGDPEFRLERKSGKKDELLSWYEEKYVQGEGGKVVDKNLLFQSKSHYPKEIVNKKLLSLASEKVEKLPLTNNRHKFMPQRIELMMEQIKREEGRQKEPKANSRDLLHSPLTKKDMMAKLDKKNTLLSTQNIPYLIEKYGLNRFQLYNLYNLFKSFQKVAVMRHPSNENTETVMKKGIDRETFEVGLKGLDMNPGDELIKGICYFGDFISWEHFIKIISISLRKTPQQKLTAILKGISSFENAYLSRHQISMMIGNSLHKLFDHQQQELKEYFTSMAMKQFDPENTGRVQVEVLKEKVLGEGSQNLNMVSFLILNT